MPRSQNVATFKFVKVLACQKRIRIGDIFSQSKHEGNILVQPGTSPQSITLGTVPLTQSYI